MDESKETTAGTRNKHGDISNQQEDGRMTSPNEDTDSEDGEDQMAAMMGFGGFGTTKNKKVLGNTAGAADIKKERTWRQYMNR